MLRKFAFVVVFQCLSASAQVPFSHPIAGEVINGGLPFVVSLYDSLSVPYLGQMKNFSLLLLTGTYTSPYTVYAWNLSTINPASISLNVTIPRALAPNGINSLFLGIKGFLISNTSISTTYFSPLFTLQNMTGPSLSAIPASTSLQASTFKFSSTPVVSISTPAPARSVSCISSSGQEIIGRVGGNGGIISPECDSVALGAFSILSKQTRSLSAAASLVTSPPPFPQFAALLVQDVLSATSSSLLSTSTSTTQNAAATASSGVEGLGPATGTSGSDSSRKTANMTYMLVIIGITLATLVMLVWIVLRYRRNLLLLAASQSPNSEEPPLRCIHSASGCECSHLRRMYDGVVTEFNLLRLGSIQSRSVISNTDAAEVEKGLASRVSRPETSGSKNELTRSGSDAVENPSPIPDNEAQRRKFEEEYRRRRASRASSRSRRSQRTILAELEGDLGPFGEESKDIIPPMPTVNALLASIHADIYQSEEDEKYESILRARNKTFVVRRKTMVGEGKTGVFIKGKVAATIVAVRRKPVPVRDGTKAKIERGSELNFPSMIEDHFAIYKENSERNEITRRNRGEIEREVEEKTGESAAKDWLDFEIAIREAMNQTRLDDLRRERRRKKRSHLAKGGGVGSRDLGLGVDVPLPSLPLK